MKTKTYSGHDQDFSKTWSLTASYKLIPGTIGLNGQKQPHSFQITGVWNLDFFGHWLSFNGFFDLWKEARPWQCTEFIFVSEPQLWVNLKNIKGWEKVNLSLGTELELSANFVAKGFHAMPTIAAKWCSTEPTVTVTILFSTVKTGMCFSREASVVPGMISFIF